MQSVHSSWSVSPVAVTLLSGLLSQYILNRARLLTEQKNISAKDYSVVSVGVELCHLGVLGEPYAEELVDVAAVIIVVACQLARRADDEDLVPLPLHGLAGVALPAAAVLRLDQHPIVLLCLAAQLVCIYIIIS